MVFNSFGLSDSTINKIKSVFKKYPEVEEVLIYGSRAKGNFKEGSDIDLSIKGRGLSEQTRKRICEDIDELNTPYLYDISIFHTINSTELTEHINRVGQIFYKKECNCPAAPPKASIR